MNRASSFHLAEPLLSPSAEPQNRFFMSDLVPGNSPSKESQQNFGFSNEFKPFWLYGKLLQMGFDKALAERVAYIHRLDLNNNFTNDEILNRAIDTCNTLQNKRDRPDFIFDENDDDSDYSGVHKSNFHSNLEEEKKDSFISDRTITRRMSVKFSPIPNRPPCDSCGENYWKENLIKIEGCEHLICKQCMQIYLLKNSNVQFLRCPSQAFCESILTPEFLEIVSMNISYVCQICYIDYPKINLVNDCLHQFCSQCLIEYLKTKVTAYQPISIKCPQNHCVSPLSEDFIEKLLSKEPELYQKYLKYKGQIEILEHPERKFCISPDCPYYVTKTPDTDKVACKCGQQMCFQCGNPWHMGMTCEEAIDKDYQQYEQRVTVKRCPKCLSKIEKNEGCNHMTCSRCKYEFCWLCRGKWIGACVNQCHLNGNANHHVVAINPLPVIPDFVPQFLLVEPDVIFRIKPTKNFFGCIATIFKFLISLVLFYVFSELLVYYSLYQWILHLTSFFSLFQFVATIIESNHRIMRVVFDFLYLMFSPLILVLSILWQIMKLLHFIMENQTRYCISFWEDKSVFGIFKSSRRRELTQEDSVIEEGYQKYHCIFHIFSSIMIGFLTVAYTIPIALVQMRLE